MIIFFMYLKVKQINKTFPNMTFIYLKIFGIQGNIPT